MHIIWCNLIPRAWQVSIFERWKFNNLIKNKTLQVLTLQMCKKYVNECV